MSSAQPAITAQPCLLPADTSVRPDVQWGKIGVMTSKERSVAKALASLRAEGLEPEPAVVELMERWGRGELTDQEFARAQKVIAAHGTLAPASDIAS
jgi:hypothetical protein